MSFYLEHAEYAYWYMVLNFETKLCMGCQSEISS